MNGGTFLGLNGIAVKSHGGTDALGFASAVDLGYEMAESDLIDRLAKDLAAFHHRLGKAPDRDMSDLSRQAKAAGRQSPVKRQE